MKRLKYVVLAAIAAFALTACEPGATTPANNGTAASANTNTNTAAATAPTVDALMTLERSAYDAWKNKDAKFWDAFLAENFVGLGPSGKMDKAAATTAYTGSNCDVKGTTLSEEEMTHLSPDAALITYKVAQDATCDGQKLPANSWGVGMYVREGGQWKGAFHAEMPIADANAQAAAPTAKPAASSTATAPADPAAETLLALEKNAWEAWRMKDAKGLGEWAGSNMVTFTEKGREDRAGAIQTWTTDACEVRSVNFTEPATTSYGPDLSLLTFKATVDGKCGGNAVGTLQGATIYTKEGGAWKAVFSVNLPIQ
jgi:hypothetical protein